MPRATILALVALGLALVLVAPPRASAQGNEYVLVRRNAFLHARPDASSERVRDPWAQRYSLRLGPFYVMRFAADHGDWTEVATVPVFRAGDHCYGTAPGLDGLDLRMFVRTSDLAPVIASTVRRSLQAGSRLTLVGGVGVTPRGRNRYEAAVRGATVRVDLTPEELVTRYRPSPKIPVSRDANAMLAPGARFDLGPGVFVATERGSGRRAASNVVSFTDDEARGGGGGSAEPPRAILSIQARPGASGRVEATLRTDCLEATGWVRDRDLTSDRPARSADLDARSGTALRAGVALYWPDGSRAGRVADHATLDGSARPEGQYVCFDHPLRPGASRRATADETLTLCVDRVSVAGARARTR